MKKFLLLIPVLFALMSCQQEKGTQQIQDEIIATKEEISLLKTKLHGLELQIKNDSGIVSEEHQILIETKTVKPEKFNHYISISGKVEAIQQAMVNPEGSGLIKKIYVEEGERVTKGQVLAELSTTVTRKAIEEVRTALDLASITYTKQKELWDQKIGSEIQYLQTKNGKEGLEKKLETLEAQEGMAKIRAPFDGIIDEIFVKEGEIGSMAAPFLEMVNLSKLLVDVDVSEKYLTSVKKGDTVRVSFPSYPDISIDAPVTRTGNIVNINNRTFKVQVKIDNHNEMLKPNIIATIAIKDYSNDSAIVVPTGVIGQDINGYFLYTTEHQDSITIARKKYVVTGISNNDQTIITSGINLREKLIMTGYNLVTDGANVVIK